MDYSFYALVAICIFLLILTFYLAVRRRRHAKRREAQNRSHEPIVNNDYEGDYNTSNVPGIIAVDMPPTNRPIRLQDYRTPFLSEYSTMTDRPHSSSNPTAAYKPEDMPQPPPPSYQDYAKDIRVLHPPSNS
ncbi:hypothetical protein BCR42DRAFT_419787 [Absidia repens]|uniref:Uncharacterized protein n=1 Tax=Absidia repens TaxID=90262 RepID=A0A1X2IAB4_9FUNG|nr:hypothetical protein BCR42DRAFT_419787 [Absidia repens]